MKKCISLILLFLLCLLVPPIKIEAHMPGQPSFFIVNGKYADLYPATLNKLPDPDAPQDIAPEKYQAGQPVTFEIDLAKFPQATPDLIKKSKFYWKFGDGDIGSGLKNTHTYKNPGKYILKIMTTDGTTSPQLFESIEVEILPNKEEAQKKSYLIYAVAGAVVIIGIVVGIIKRRVHS